MTAMLELEGISKRFVKSLDLAEKLANRFGADLREEVVRAVDNVSFTVSPGEIVGVVGESGCGKSTLGRMIAGILPPTEGSILYKGQPFINATTGSRPDTALALKVQMIFQDPFSSLNPRKQVIDIITEAPLHHGLISSAEKKSFATEMLAQVGLDGDALMRYPHQFSGGQRQRVGIARALAVSPEFLVCDESIAALDVSIQAQIINLFMKLRDSLGLTYLFISHDIGVIEHIADQVVVMYLGRVVEKGPVDALFSSPNHPYTHALLEGVPRLEAGKRDFVPVSGEIPSPLDPPGGCHFHPRCPFATDRCRQERPALKAVAGGHLSACHRNDETG